MPDIDSQIRHAMEALIQQRIDAEASRRGWDLGGDARAAQGSPMGAVTTANPALVFATGLDPITNLTTVPFTFDFSPFDGPDILV